MKLKLATLLLLSATAHAGCQADQSDYTNPVSSGPGLPKMFHVTGRHQCQSRDFIGYWVDVEVRDAIDCDNGHSRLRNQNPCRFKDGKEQKDYGSIGYYPGSCSAFG